MKFEKRNNIPLFECFSLEDTEMSVCYEIFRFAKLLNNLRDFEKKLKKY